MGTASGGVAFLDIESTGLDPDRHDIWEIGLVVPDEVFDETFEAMLPANVAQADPGALRVGRFYERRAPLLEHGGSVAEICMVRADGNNWAKASSRDVAQFIAVKLAGRTLVNCVPWFDDRFLARWLNRHGQQVSWDYHLLDVESMALGYLAATRPDKPIVYPWTSKHLTDALGVEPPSDDERHTALGDALWAKRMWSQITGREW
jgi:DNA polymerase III epsilon subunit-like protein